MDDEPADGLLLGKSDQIAQLIESYISDHEEYSVNTHRNNLLLILVNEGDETVVSEINKFWINASDPVVKKHLAQLIFELISRTNDIFDGSVLRLLTLCYKATVSLHHGILATRALLQQHIKLDQERIQKCKSELEGAFKCLLGLDIASLGQIPRIDFLWIAHYVFELKCRHGLEADFCKVFSVLVGEKDPRNLIMMFELCAKVCKNSTDLTELEHAANLFVPYFPIQFVPPRNDKIGIQPSELKQGLLECFVAHSDLGKFTLEVLVDSLYCSLVNQEEHCAVLTDVCEYLESCTNKYTREAFVFLLDSVCDAILSELFNLGPEVTYAEVPNQLNVEILDHLQWLNIKNDEFIVNKSQQNCKEYEGVPCDAKAEIQKLASSFYHPWENVSPRLHLFGKITTIIFQVIQLPKGASIKELSRFFTSLRTFIMTGDAGASLDGHAGFLLDAICRIPHWHDSILSHVIWSICTDIVNGYQKIWDADDGNKSATLPIANLDMLVNLLASITSTLEFYIPKYIGNAIILAGICCSIANESGEHYHKGLNLLVLGSVASRSPIANTIADFLVRQGDFANPGIKSHRELQLLTCLVDMYKCREDIGTILSNKVENLLELILESNNVCANVEKYFNGAKLCKIYGQVTRVAIGRRLLVRKFVKAACTLIEASILDNFKSKQLVMATCAVANALVQADPPDFNELVRQEFKVDLQGYSSTWHGHHQEVDSNYTLLLLIWLIERFMRSSIDFNGSDLVARLLDGEVVFLLPLYIHQIPFEHLWANLDYMLDQFRSLQANKKLDDIGLLKMECCGLVLQHTFTRQQDKLELLNAYNFGKIPTHATLYLAQALCDTPYFEEVFINAGYKSWNLLHWLSCTLSFDTSRMHSDLETLGFDARDLNIGNYYSNNFFGIQPIALDSLPKKIKYQWLHAQASGASQTQPPPVELLVHLLSQQLTQMPISDAKCKDLGLVLAIVELLLCMQTMPDEHVGLIMDIYMKLDKTNWQTLQCFHDERAWDISPYQKWTFESFLIKVQLLILRILVQHLVPPKVEYNAFSFSLEQPCQEKSRPACTNVGLLWLSGRFIQDTATMALECESATVKILAILVLHASFGVARIPGYNFQNIMECRHETIKRLSALLGYPNKRVRAVALKCREKWLAANK